MSSFEHVHKTQKIWANAVIAGVIRLAHIQSAFRVTIVIKARSL